MIAMISWVSLEARGADCVRTTLPAQELATEGATALAIRDVIGRIELSPGAGDVVQVEAESCGADVRLRLQGGVPTVTSRRDAGADLVVRVRVPARVEAVSLVGVTGDVAVSEIPARIAVISSAGDISASGVGGLRVAWHHGDVRVAGVDPVVDHLDGALTVEADASGPIEPARNSAP